MEEKERQKKAIMIGLIAFVLIAIVYTSPRKVTPAPTVESAAQAARTPASFKPAFALTTMRGVPVTNASFQGKHMVVFLGYSQCPDICPIVLSTLTQAMKALGPDADKLAVLFITLDPAHDTPARLTQYMSAFDPRMLGLTGSPQAVQAAAAAFRVVSTLEPVPLGAAPGTAPLITHSGYVFVLDEQGNYQHHYNSNLTPEQMTQVLRQSLHSVAQ